MSMVSHIGFSDESHWNEGRFRSISLVSLSLDQLENVNSGLRNLLVESNVSEFKWNKLSGARERSAAMKMCEFAVERALASQLRIDVLVWDTQDRRHNVLKRDDIGNLQRMYYHLFHNVLRKRWPDNAIWRLHPDEHTAMNWQTVEDCLGNVAKRVEVDDSLFTSGKFRIRLRQEFSIEEIQAVASGNHPLLQLADLFAGLAVFSREKYGMYREWKDRNSGQAKLFDDGNGTDAPSRSSQERFQVLAKLSDLSKKHRLDVSLEIKQGLWTPNPKKPLNFWMYEPQHPLDKAPQRS